MAAKFTFQQFKAQYPDDEACLQAIFERRFNRDPNCPGCGVVGAKFHRVSGRRAWACQDCGYHLYPCAGTVFDKSPTPLTLWFHAMYLMTSTRNGVSAKELERQLGVTYKCAWRIGHQLRALMAARDKTANPGQLKGHVEIDETYIGGNAKTGKRGRNLQNKTVVMGLVQRRGPIKGHVVENNRKTSLLPHVLNDVATGSVVSTDNLGSYKKLSDHGYHHVALNHEAKEWASGIHHTNRIEGFWSHLKRGIGSTHVHVSKKYMQNYVDEFAYRYNNRHAPASMFNRLVAQISKPKVSS